MKNIRLVATDSGPSRLLQPTSEARLRLAKLISDRLAIEDNLRSLVAAGAKLAEAADAERNAGAKLAALDAEEAATMAAWAKTGGAMPQFDRSRHANLEIEVHASAAQASAARSAAGANGSEQQRELGRLKALEPQFAIAIAEVIAESVEPLFADFEIANRALASKAERIQSAFVEIRGIAEAIGNSTVARPVYQINERLHERIRVASARPAPDGANHRASWAAFAQELRRDPIAEFKS